RQPELRLLAVSGDQLREAARAAGHLAAFAGFQLDVVNLRAQRNVFDRKRVAGEDVRFGAGNHGLSHPQSGGRNDVSLPPVSVSYQSDAGGAIRIILDGRDFTGNAELVALEIYDAVVALVSAATMTHGHFAEIVSAAGALLTREQRLMRLIRRQIVV